jgi:hypothetical protein
VTVDCDGAKLSRIPFTVFNTAGIYPRFRRTEIHFLKQHLSQGFAGQFPPHCPRQIHITPIHFLQTGRLRPENGDVNNRRGFTWPFPAPDQQAALPTWIHSNAQSESNDGERGEDLKPDAGGHQ